MRTVLIVEDDLMIADDLEEVLTDAGYSVCGIARTLQQAVTLMDLYHPHLGIIDMRLADGEHGVAVAQALGEHGPLGVLYATGNPDHPMIDGAHAIGCIGKPYSAEAVVAALHVVDEKLTGAAHLSAFPRGFRLLQH